MGVPIGTHCRHGHLYSGDNLYVGPGGQKRCRACNAIQHRKKAGSREASERAKDYRRRHPDRQRREDAKADPVKQRSRRLLRQAVFDGRIKKPKNCVECGRGGRIHGHHEDYSQPFSVEWLCPVCHGVRHRKPLTGTTTGGGDGAR